MGGVMILFSIGVSTLLWANFNESLRLDLLICIIWLWRNWLCG